MRLLLTEDLSIEARFAPVKPARAGRLRRLGHGRRNARGCELPGRNHSVWSASGQRNYLEDDVPGTGGVLSSLDVWTVLVPLGEFGSAFVAVRYCLLNHPQQEQHLSATARPV